MPADYKGAFFDALKITVVGLLTYVTQPWLDETFPWMPEWLRFAIPAFVGSMILLALWVLGSGRAHLEVVWRKVGEVEVDVQTVIAELAISQQGAGLDLFEISVHHVGGRGAGRLALRLAAWSGLSVNVAILHTEMAMAHEGDQAGLANGMIVPGNDCSVQLILDSRVAAPGTVWARNKFRFQGKTQSSTTHWTADHDGVAVGRLAKVCAKLIKVDSKVESVVEHWK